AVAHFSFAQNGRQHWYRRVSGYAYTDGLLPKNERHTYRIDYKYDTSDCDAYFFLCGSTIVSKPYTLLETFLSFTGVVNAL
ncbi:MAG: hypothetical protein IJ155_11150, partial [Prevotella sp.]|nr:hypothetical protein [Prevotella sp.]